ncbi:uncharacterized protein RHO25_008938 [Cercospora beticola]|uniref:Uncharacterized protein n=1 Tax=Cercospora beticola TaxID=122368 RepID=A0ABZ0NXH4_CERBT|nr:hypothetical protein RHO25_008938 [Cercospora beticola]
MRLPRDHVLRDGAFGLWHQRPRGVYSASSASTSCSDIQKSYEAVNRNYDPSQRIFSEVAIQSLHYDALEKPTHLPASIALDLEGDWAFRKPISRAAFELSTAECSGNENSTLIKESGLC